MRVRCLRVERYTYDAEGDITQVDGGKTAQYAYDAFNRRTKVETPSASTEYAYDYAGRRVSSWLSPNNLGEEGRIYWDGLQVAYRSTIDGTTYFDHQDTLGTERERTNYAGSVESSYPSGIWGDNYTDTVNSSGAGQDNARFAGLEYDAESGTEHAQFRNSIPRPKDDGSLLTRTTAPTTSPIRKASTDTRTCRIARPC